MKVQIFFGLSTLDVQNEVNEWLTANGERVVILRVGDALPTNTGRIFMTVVYEERQEKLFETVK